jgi:hypothetical protein
MLSQKNEKRLRVKKESFCKKKGLGLSQHLRLLGLPVTSRAPAGGRTTRLTRWIASTGWLERDRHALCARSLRSHPILCPFLTFFINHSLTQLIRSNLSSITSLLLTTTYTMVLERPASTRCSLALPGYSTSHSTSSLITLTISSIGCSRSLHLHKERQR